MRTFVILAALTLSLPAYAQSMLCNAGETDCLRSRDYTYGGARNQEDYYAKQRWQQNNYTAGPSYQDSTQPWTDPYHERLPSYGCNPAYQDCD
jgi:hypothetical protein